MKTIIVIDDEKTICQSLQFALEDQYHTYTFTNPIDALEVLKEIDAQVVLLDLKIGEVDGLEILHEIKKQSPKTVVIIMTAFGSLETSLDALSRGAFYYINKPIRLEELELLLTKALEFYQLNDQVDWLSEELQKANGKMGIIGNSSKMKGIFQVIEKIKDIDSSVLITGESGTGKEVVARAIHFQGNRKHHRFMAINCAAIPSQLLESELFGYEKGAFTGASQRKPGLFHLAHGGTLFLDEIGEMEPFLQSKLLRVIQEKKFTPLGASHEITSDVRIISATNQDLKKQVALKQFREDLFYRLNVIPISLPPLRERKEDIPLLTHHFLKQISERMGKKVPTITRHALTQLEAYEFPGNVRELQNMIERAIALLSGENIDVLDLFPDISPSAFWSLNQQQKLIPIYTGETFEDVEKKVILANVLATGGNRKRAAEMLKIGERTLRDKVKKYNLNENG
jgi:two-component system, NtrC family, response regulator AtoC